MVEITDKAQAKAFADTIRDKWPDMAAKIDKAIADGGDLNASDPGFKITAQIRYKLEKFHGDKKPGDVPFETIEGEG